MHWLLLVSPAAGLLMSRILPWVGPVTSGPTMKALTQAGHEPVAFDDLSTGHADAVIYGELVEGDIARP